MAIRVALHHKTEYLYDHPVAIFPQTVRLRPAPHCRTPILSYSLKVLPQKQFVNWQQDPHGNFLARFVFPEKSREFSIEVDLIAEMTVVNPFDFFLELSAETFPFAYDPVLAEELKPFLAVGPLGTLHAELLTGIDRSKMPAVDFLVMLNGMLHERIKYVIRMDPGVQTCEETLRSNSGSCRDTAWLLVQTLRNLGLAARFVSGYLIQLTADIKSLDGPTGPAEDFTDLHAWAEVYLPGAGWIGLDATSGLWAGEGHIPLAATPDPASAAPVTGAVDPCEAKFSVAMSVSRIHEDPRVTKPYSEEQWQRIESLGHRIDAALEADAVRLTMGGEPTFVSIDDMDGPEWNTLALGKNKRLLAGDLTARLRKRFAANGLLHTGQGKWYPGESLPRWAARLLLAERRPADVARFELARRRPNGLFARDLRCSHVCRRAGRTLGRAGFRGSGLRRHVALSVERGSVAGQRRSAEIEARLAGRSKTAGQDFYPGIGARRRLRVAIEPAIDARRHPLGKPPVAISRRANVFDSRRFADGIAVAFGSLALVGARGS